jgi:hypothetical protein
MRCQYDEGEVGFIRSGFLLGAILGVRTLFLGFHRLMNTLRNQADR